ncbi:MAG: HEAT repeat domain-containing protein, partial [Phycisphaerales bacterium]|nr:HEAT repeat domain-containing protein [Phycisphaerales bacterium]
SFEAARARALADEIVRPDAPHAQIASCFEGLGRKALPALTELYSQARDFVSFHAAAAGLRLDDHIAGDVIATHASDPKSPFRFQAIRALGEATDIGGTAVSLRKLLTDEDPRVQVAAYEALIRRHDPTIDSHIIGSDNFILDVIPASPSRFVYVKRTEERRIALFGDDLRCTPPVLYRSPDGSLTLNARSGDEEFTAIRTVIARDLSSPPLPAPFELPQLVTLLGNEAAIAPSGKVLGLGLDYGVVVHAVYDLCQIRAVDAQFVLEQPNAAELFGPRRPQGRPESEL